MERGECVAILGQNGSGKSTLVRLLSTLLINDGGEARIFGHDAFHETRADPAAREPRLRRGELLQEDVRVREPLVRGALLRHAAVADARTRSRRSYDGRLPGRPPPRGDGEPVARHAAEGRARACAPHVTGAAAARRADDGPRPALEARGAGVHPATCASRTTRRSCSARTTWPRRRRSPTASACSTAASCSSSSRSRT